MPALDLTGQKLRDTYQRVVQVSAGNFYDGLGNFIVSSGITGVTVVPKENLFPDGSTVDFVLANTPLIGTEHVFFNGVLLSEGDDYTISGPNIHLLITPPLSTQKLVVTYFM